MTSEMMGGYGCCWPFLPFPLSESQFWAWKWFERTSVVTDLLWASFVFRVKVGVAVYLCLNSHRGREWVPSWENPQQLYRLNCQGNLLSHSVPTGQRLAYYRLQAKSAPTSFYKWRLTETQPCLSVDVFSMATFVLWRQSWVAATEIIWSVKSKIFTNWPVWENVCRSLLWETKTRKTTRKGNWRHMSYRDKTDVKTWCKFMYTKNMP